MRFLRIGLGLLLVLVLAFFLRSSQGRTAVDALDARDVSEALDPTPRAQLEAPLAGKDVPQPVRSDVRSPLDEASGAAERVPVQGEADPEGRTLRVRVLDAATGFPLEGVRIVGPAEQQTDAEGIAHLTLRPEEFEDRLSLELTKRGYVRMDIPRRRFSVSEEARMHPGVPFEVIVTDGRTGQPLPKASVSARQWSKEPYPRIFSAHSTTAESGIASIPEVYPDLPVHVRISKSGYVSAMVDLRVGSTLSHEVLLGVGGRVECRVVGADGSPESAYGVFAAGLDGSRLAGSFHDLQGRREVFQIAGLPLETPMVVCSRSAEAVSRPFLLTADRPEASVTLHLPGRPAKLTVIVTDEDGTPWRSASCLARTWVPPERADWPSGLRDTYQVGESSDDEGRMELELRSGVRLALDVGNGMGGTQSTSVLMQPGEERRLEVVIPRGLGVHGRVVDTLGNPLTGLRVSFDGIDCVTDEDGGFEYLGLDDRPGDLTVQRDYVAAEVPPVVTWMSIDSVRPGGDPIELVRPDPVRVTAQLADPLDVRWIRWNVHFADGRRLFVPSHPGEGGDTEILVAVEESNWDVSAQVGNYDRSGSIQVFYDFSRKPGSQVDLGRLGEPVGVVVSGVVRRSDGSPAANVEVQLDLDRLHYRSRRRTDQSGFFRFDDVPPEPGSLLARLNDSTESGECPFEAGTESEAIQLRLERRGRVHGVVLDAGGGPVVGAELWMYRVEGSKALELIDRIPTDESGTFSQYVDVGVFQLFVQHRLRSGAASGPRIKVEPGPSEALRIQVP